MRHITLPIIFGAGAVWIYRPDHPEQAATMIVFAIASIVHGRGSRIGDVGPSSRN
jgi:hypothetical protein